MPGGDLFLGDRDGARADRVSEATGVDSRKLTAAADLFREARKVVFVHSKDRSRDKAPGDIDTLCNLALLLRNAGFGAELLLPSMAANGAAMGITGADPVFQAGRKPAPKLPGARDRGELQEMLKEGKIRGALIIGEDPMRYSRTASYFGQIEFLAYVDWAYSETAQFADVSIPGSTFLESEGTRCNFEGEVKHYVPAVTSPGGAKTWQVLRNVADHLGVELPAVFDTISSGIQRLAKENLGDLAPFYLGGGDDWDGAGNLVSVNYEAKASPRSPALTAMAHYKREVQEVGIEHFRVGKRRQAR